MEVLKRIYLKKIMVASLALFALLLLYLTPDSEDARHELSYDNVEYVYSNKAEVIYLLDSNDYVARTTIRGCDCNKEEEIKDVLEGLIIDGSHSNTIPNGFRSVIPAGTQILNLDLNNGVVTINFSRELLDINEKYEEKMIEAIVYTLTSIDGISGVSIKVEGEDLTNLPNSHKSIPNVLDKSYGINKSYDLVSTNGIESYTVYYVSNYNDSKYYVPVTKYVNDDTNSDKVKVIINELSSSPIYETNLISYLSSDTSLIDYTLEGDVLKLNFNDSILDANSGNKILEEVIYTVSLSAMDNYKVKEVDFMVDNKEILKKSLKTLE